MSEERIGPVTRLLCIVTTFFFANILGNAAILHRHGGDSLMVVLTAALSMLALAAGLAAAWPWMRWMRCSTASGKVSAAIICAVAMALFVGGALIKMAPVWQQTVFVALALAAIALGIAAIFQRSPSRPRVFVGKKLGAVIIALTLLAPLAVTAAEVASTPDPEIQFFSLEQHGALEFPDFKGHPAWFERITIRIGFVGEPTEAEVEWARRILSRLEGAIAVVPVLCEIGVCATVIARVPPPSLLSGDGSCDGGDTR